jgi:nucleotide-binding universal stress UspA family protein
MNRILVATDGSPSSAHAIALAIKLASEQQSELIFVHVVQALDVVPPIAIDGIGSGFAHQPTDHDHALLADAAAAATEHGVVATTALRLGSTVKEIVAAADLYGVDLTVVGSCGHNPLAGALLGSVSLGVLRESTCPVVIVRGAKPPRSPADAAGAPGGHR